MLKISLDWQGKKIECEVFDIEYPICRQVKTGLFFSRKITEYRHLENLHEYLDDDIMWKIPNNNCVRFYVKPNDGLDEWFKAYQVGNGFPPLKQNVVADGKIYIENDTVNRWKNIMCACIIEYDENPDNGESYYVITADY